MKTHYLLSLPKFLLFLSFFYFSPSTNASNLGSLAPIAPVAHYKTEDSTASALTDGCPKSCKTAGSDPSNWTHIHDTEDLKNCYSPLLFDFAIQNEPSKYHTIRTCVAFPEVPRRQLSNANTTINWKDVNTTNVDAVEKSVETSKICGAAETSVVTSSLELGPTGILSDIEDTTAAGKLLASYAGNGAPCGRTIIFAKYRNTIAALYAGADVEKGSVGKAVHGFVDHLQNGTEVLQLCQRDAAFSQTVGLAVADSVDSLAHVQNAMITWAKGGCVDIDGAQTQKRVDLEILAAPKTAKRNLSLTGLRNAILPRSDCKVIQVGSGDSCGSLASRCGISGADFTKYNPQKTLCSSLVPKQRVCCSAGSLPDMTPKPQADGSCAVHQIASGDSCADIAGQNGLKPEQINDFNNATWGWDGCSRLQVGQKICLSEGNVPMPNTYDNAVCGPQKPGTKRPPGKFTGWDLAKLNPCPLNACCSGWGFCGTTDQFCTESPADTGAPGSSKNGTNGCISNCGTDIVGKHDKPDTFRRIAYFEAFNVNRECLTMDASEISTKSDLTHVHFAFAGLTEDFGITFDDGVKEQFDTFVKIDAPWKKILSFGGWAESTDEGTFQRYRDAVKPAYREKFADNVAKFLADNKLDGVDFDWEYPGATDIPGVPAGGTDEASDYLDFLKLMEGKLNGLSLSIALPASYWYLKPFPIEKMAPHLSYFIYMTYDLHGQWDYGNKFANPGCAQGNCLRSHVNKTETYNSLAMITKAGVPASKVAVGIASYGRSFGMANSTCTGPTCEFTGNFTHSTAEPGSCTNTGGYIANAELADIEDSVELDYPGYNMQKWHDDDSDSDIMVYGTSGNITTWAAYMTEDTRKSRVNWIQGLNFGGTTDWALDLVDWHKGPARENGNDTDPGIFENLPSLDCNPTDWPTSLEDLSKNIDSIPTVCRSQAVVRVLRDELEDAISNYEEASKGYDEKFKWYVEWVKDSIDGSLDSFMSISGNGSKYMDCHWTSKRVNKKGPCTDVDFKLGDLPPSNQGPRSVTYTMRDEDGFYKALLADYDIQKDWIYWKRQEGREDPCDCPYQLRGTGCPDCGTNSVIYYNYPRRIKDTSKIDIKNPKEIVDKAIPNTNELSDVMLSTYIEMSFGTLNASDNDVATAFSMPVFMLQDATTQIKAIKKIGAEEKKEKTRNLVLGILSIVLSVVPFAGDAAAALGGATAIARVAFIVGEAGNVALSIADIVADPKSAPFAILNVVGSAAGIRAKGPRKAFEDAANTRRSLSPEKMKLFGESFVRKDALVQGILKKCAL